MGQITRCPLTGGPCVKPITIEEKTFFLAEAEEPDYDRQHRKKAIKLAIVDGYKIRSALDEKGINAFSCKICEMIQTCAYGIADITQRNPNVLLELGIMIALGKPAIILVKKEQDKELELFSDLKAIEVIPFEEYLDMVDQLREVVCNLPSPVSPPNPIQDLERIQPKFAEELKKTGANIFKEFKKSIEEAKLNAASFGDEKKELSPQLDERLKKLEEKLEDLRGLGFATDADTASSRANYFYNRGEYKEALASLNWLVELRPDDPDILSNRGLTYCELGMYEESLADYNRSLELRSDDPGILSNRGLTYSYLQRYDEALADYNRSLELRPDNTRTLNNRGVTYSYLGRYDEALTDYNHSLELEPDDATTLYNLACLFSLLKKTDEALAYLEKAIALDKKYLKMAKTDKDFANIREDARFKKLIESE